MSMRPIQRGSVNQSVIVRIIDSTNGTGETGVTAGTSGIDFWYRRETKARVAITEANLAAVDSAHSDGGIEHIDDGYYRLDPPDAAWLSSAGVDGVMIGGGITGMIVIGCYVPLVAYDPYNVANLGLTNLDTTVASRASAGAYTSARAGYLDELAAANLPTDIADIPTVAEFEARSIVSANYVVVGDTIAGVTAVTDVTGDVKGNVDGTVAGVTPEAAGVAPTANEVRDAIVDDATQIDASALNAHAAITPEAAGVAPTASEVVTAMQVDGTYLFLLIEALVNKLQITEANGNVALFNDAGGAAGTIAAAFTSVAGTTQRLRIVG